MALSCVPGRSVQVIVSLSWFVIMVSEDIYTSAAEYFGLYVYIIYNTYNICVCVVGELCHFILYCFLFNKDAGR